MNDQSKKKNRWPVIILFLLSPVIGELLSGSAPPLEFFNPPLFLVMTALYGSGAILVRELRVRWGKPWWPTVFILGAAYGIVEEGLACKSFFDPRWGDLGTLGVYGRWAGVNWVWAFGLTLFHTAFSIGAAIILVELLFPDRRDERWLGRRGMAGFWLLLAAVTLFGFGLLTPYRPPLPHVLLTIGVIVALFLLARWVPTRPPAPRPGRVPRPFRFALFGFFANVALFATLWIAPEIGVPAWLDLLIIAGLAAGVAWRVRRLAGGSAWTDEHRFALTAGSLTLFVLWAPITEAPVQMSFVSVVAIVLLIWMWRRLRSRAREDERQTLRLAGAPPQST